MSCKSKLASSLNALNSVRSNLSRQCLLMRYNSLVLPHISYGILLWGSASQSLINKISIMQKKVIRSVTRSNYNAHTDPLFAELKTFKLCDIYDYTLGKYMYSQKNKLLPQPLLLTYSENQDVHSYNTRNKSLIQSQNRRTAIAPNSHIHKTPCLWNNIPKEIKELPSLKLFSTKLRRKILSEY